MSVKLADLYQIPGTRLKRWVVELRREQAWEAETCPRIDVPEHDDNTGGSCRNVGQAMWTHLEHDCCNECCDLHQATANRPDVAEWNALWLARPPITADLDELSDEVQPELEWRTSPVLSMLRRG